MFCIILLLLVLFETIIYNVLFTDFSPQRIHMIDAVNELFMVSYLTWRFCVRYICIYRYLIFATRIFIDVFVDSSVWLTIIYVFKSYIAENRPGFRDFRKFLARIQKCGKIPGSGFKNVFYWFVVRFIYMEHVDTNVNLVYVRSKTKFRGGRMESRVALKIYWRWKHRVKNSRRYGCWMEE